MSYDAVIVGAGIVGAACAAELNRRGLKVAVVDRNPPGTVATAACMGHVVVMDDNKAQLELTKYSARLWNDFVKDLPPSCENALNGTLWVAEDDEEMAAVYEKEKLYSENGIPAEVLNQQQLYKWEPNLKPGCTGALRVPGDRVVYPTNCTSVLMKNIDFKSAEVKSVKAGEVTLVSGEKISAGHVIVANGARAGELLPELPVKPRKGHLVITERYPDFVKHQIVELGYLKSAHSFDPESVAFNIQPRSTGQLLIGSSREFTGFDKSINKSILRKMIDRACYYMPGLRKVRSLRVWTGLRPASHDGLPYIGSWSEDGLWTCTGHEGLGITTSLASAKILASQMLKEESPIAADPFKPERVFNEQLTAH